MDRMRRPVSNSTAEAIAYRLRVLGQPLRIRIVDLLEREAEMSVGGLAEGLGETVHNVSQHLAILRAAGVVRRRQHGREALDRLSGPAAIGIYEYVVVTLREEAHRLGEALDAPDLDATGAAGKAQAPLRKSRPS